MSPQKKLKTIILACAILIPSILVGTVFLYRSITKELDEKFYVAIDSVPTRVYSSVFWIKPGVGFSIEELRYRLKEREYREVAQPAAPGQFHLDLSAGEEANISIYTNSFAYPDSAREMFFSSSGALGEHPSLVKINWKQGEVKKITDASGHDVGLIALEPVLVAQLNSNSTESRKTIALAQMPNTLLEAIVLVEDQRFLEHSGIDPRGIMRSIWVNLRAGSYQQGASTITQQLIKNIYLNRNRTLSRKGMEIVMALLLEFRFSKDQILEKYLNEVYFGQSGNIAIHGVSQAAKFYFDKNLDELSIAQQAMLAAFVRGPIFYSPFHHLDRAKKRQELVLTKMLEGGIITKTQFNQAKVEPLHFAKVSAVQDRAPYFTDMIKAQLLRDLQEQEVIGVGYQVFSTLDTYYQSLAAKSVERGLENLEAMLKQRLAKQKNPPTGKALQGVFMAVNPETGHLLALVGGRSYEESSYNRALLMRREVGSLFKPFVYLAALIHGENEDGTPMNAISKMEDKPFTYEFDGKSWSPKNYEDEFVGAVTLRYALANSINTVAAQLAVKVGLPNVVAIAKSAGIDTNLEALPSLALGAVGLAPIEVITAYNTLANFGMRREVTAVLLVVDQEGKAVAHFLPKEEQALPAAETANLVDMLRSVFSIGTGKYAKIAFPVAGKTGTTNEFRDSWFAGFSSKITAVTWVGFDRDDEASITQRKLLKLTGAVGALPIWTEFMNAAHRSQPAHDFVVPDGLLRKLRVDLITGGKANSTCEGANVTEEVFTDKNAPQFECH